MSGEAQLPASKYKIWAWGSPVGQGATGSVHVGMAAVAKKATAAEPHIVANEIFCSLLARVALLPCPPGALLEKNAETYFCSLDFNTSGQSLPPVSPAAVLAQDTALCWGIVLFDVLVMNADRHKHNMSHNTQTGVITIFDHSHAFMRTTGDVDATMKATDGQLAIGGHCIAAVLDSWNGFSKWRDRLQAIPDYYLEGAVETACRVGLPQGKQQAIVAFVKKRRDTIGDIMKSNLASFPKLPSPPSRI